MSDVKFANDGAKGALADIRKDSCSDDWVVCGYGGDGSVVLQARGGGGLDELRRHLDVKQIQYALVRLQDVVDGHSTTKFVWIVWLGEQVKMVAKARVTTHRGALKDFFGQAHVTVDAANLDEVSDAIVMAKVTDASGTSVRTLKDADSRERQQADRTVNAGGRMEKGSLDIRDKEAGKEALQRVRAGTTDGEDDWLLLAYAQDGSNVVELRGQGGGGASQLAHLLDDKTVAYGLVRVSTALDNNKVTRFVAVVFVGSAIGGLRKAQIVTHKGTLLEFLGQHHVELATSDPQDVNNDAVLDLVNRAAGVRDNVAAAEQHHPQQQQQQAPSRQQAAPAPNAGEAKPAPKYSSPGASLISNPKKGNAVNTTSVQLDFDDADSIRKAIAAVRSDDDPTDWMLMTYSGEKSVKLVSSGTGGGDELARHVDDVDTGAYYGYVRVPTVVDGTQTVKFVFVIYLGDKIKVVRKAKLATHKGAVQEFVGQYHFDITFTDVKDVTSEAISKAVSVNTFESTRK